MAYNQQFNIGKVGQCPDGLSTTSVQLEYSGHGASFDSEGFFDEWLEVSKLVDLSDGQHRVTLRVDY